jgi:hypothetical protein
LEGHIIKKILFIGVIFICIIVSSQGIHSGSTTLNTQHESLGAFKLLVNPPAEPIIPGEIVEVEGVHQLIPSIFDRILPTLWVSEYTEIEVAYSPDWCVVSIPDKDILTPPSGDDYRFYLYIVINDDAPMNYFDKISLNITTGKFMRTIFPSWFPLCNEFNMDIEFIIQTGEW